jgi:hypothetical protein
MSQLSSAEEAYVGEVSLWHSICIDQVPEAKVMPLKS